MTPRENYIRMARFGGPEWIPCSAWVPPSAFCEHRLELERIVARHGRLFPRFEVGKIDYDRFEYPPHMRVGDMTNPWGCVWRNALAGHIGTVAVHPLADWSAFESYRPPEPRPQNSHTYLGTWEDQRANFEQRRAKGLPCMGNIGHGFFLLRMCDLRGFQNLMCDLLEQPPELGRLLDLVRELCVAQARGWVEAGADGVNFGEDLGSQTGPLISPAMFARFVTPAYQAMMAPVRQAGKLVYLHSDGHILELLDELAAAGVDIINPQDLVNGIDNLARLAKGRFAIDLDIDRQRIIPFGTPRDIEAHIDECVGKLASPQGGLSMKVSIYPPTPLENFEALFSALEKYGGPEG